jgi:hypothetical protein
MIPALEHNSRCIVRPSVVEDVYRLAAALRQNDREEVEALGVDPRMGIRRSFRDGTLRRTYFVDGEIAAMSGLCGALLGDIGEPYLMTTPAAERVPITLVRQAKFAVADMMRHKLRLEGHAAAQYTGALRLLEVLGFKLYPPAPFGPKGALFVKYTMMRD